ncbi:MAG: SGNH/GDSL hydrolase family protein [Ekhidna sp.]
MRFLTLALIVLLSACSNEKKKMDPNHEFTFLALGDSYTIGEAVEESERWPVQLTRRLKEDSINVTTRVIATTGWTTDELQKALVVEDLDKEYDLVSLLIGVNNQYRGYDEDQYEKEFKELLHKAVELAGGNPYHVFVISIPDYGVTPFAAEKELDPEKIAHELDSYNAIAEKIATLSDVHFFNITPESRAAKTDSTLIASDGLHPSGKMYEMWVDEVYKFVFDNLSSR